MIKRSGREGIHRGDEFLRCLEGGKCSWFGREKDEVTVGRESGLCKGSEMRKTVITAGMEITHLVMRNR